MQFVYIALCFILGALLLDASNQQTLDLARIADCVAYEARAQGYAGNVYSRDAWDLFAPNCK